MERNAHTYIFILFCLAVFYSQALFASDNHINTQVVGTYPLGPGNEIAYDTTRDLYFVTSGAAVLVMNLSQPGNPVVINDKIAMNNRVGDIEFDATHNLLYVAAKDLHVWNVSDINNPLQVSVLSHDTAGNSGFSVESISQQGNMLYGVDDLDLHAIDISNPNNPVLKDTYTQFYLQGSGDKASFNGVASKGSFIFATGAEIDMRIFEYTDDTGISFIQSTSWSVNTSYSPVVHGNHLYYYSSSFGTGLAVMDVTSRDTFAQFSTPVYPEYAKVLAVTGNMAFVSSNLPGTASTDVYLIDLSEAFNFSAPLATLSYASPVEAMAVSSERVAALTRYDDLQIANYSNPSLPVTESTYVLDGSTTRIHLNGSLALLSQPTSGVQVIDVADPRQPARKSTIPRTVYSMNAVSEGNVAYILDGQILSTFDITDSSAPMLLGQYTLTPPNASTSSQAKGLAVSGDIAIASVLSDVEIIDVSQSDNPRLLGRHLSRDVIRNVRIYGNHVYISSSAGLEIIDISNPSSPREVGFFAVRFNNDTIKQGNYAYAISALDGFYVLDVSNISNIQQVGFVDITGTITSLAVNGNYAMVANTYSGARLFDISMPSNPSLLGLFSDKNITGIMPLNNYFLASGRYVGMKTIQNLLDDGRGQPDPEPTPNPAPEPNQAPVADAGPDQTVASRGTVTLDGTASYDPDGGNIGYQWVQTSGKEVSLNNADTANPTFRAPNARRGDKVMVFELTITDDAGLQSMDTVTITAVR